MKIPIKALEPNPFRNIETYPIDEEKVKGLVKSIQDTTFWDNILVRAKPGSESKYEIAYGHHRLVALRRVHGERSGHTVDIPVRDLDDALMLKIMANENAKDWELNTAVVIETVKAARDFLAKHPEHLMGSRRAGATERSSVEGPQIAAFLGGVFTASSVEDALSIINAVERKEVDAKAVRKIAEPTKAVEFVRAVKQSERRIPVPEQRKMGQLVRKEEVPRAAIKETFARWGYAPTRAPKELPDAARFLRENLGLVRKLTEYAKALATVKDDLHGVEWLAFRTACEHLHTALDKLL